MNLGSYSNLFELWGYFKLVGEKVFYFRIDPDLSLSLLLRYVTVLLLHFIMSRTLRYGISRNKLYDCLRDCGLTQVLFSNKAGFSQSYLSLRSSNNPKYCVSYPKMKQIKDAFKELGVSTNGLFFEFQG